MGVETIVAGGLTAAGSVFGANASANAAENKTKTEAALTREQLAENQRQYNTTTANSQARQGYAQNAFENTLGQGKLDLAQGEQGFLNAANQAPASLTQAKSDITQGLSEGLNAGAREYAASLAGQGVRGGQASTLLNRNIGGMATTAQRDLTQMGLSDEEQRAAELRAYQASKAGAGRSALLGGNFNG